MSGAEQIQPKMIGCYYAKKADRDAGRACDAKKGDVPLFETPAMAKARVRAEKAHAKAVRVARETARAKDEARAQARADRMLNRIGALLDDFAAKPAVFTEKPDQKVVQVVQPDPLQELSPFDLPAPRSAEKIIAIFEKEAGAELAAAVKKTENNEPVLAKKTTPEKIVAAKEDSETVPVARKINFAKVARPVAYELVRLLHDRLGQTKVSLKTVRNSTHKVVGVQIIVTYQTAEGGTFTAPLKNIDAKLAKQLEAYAWKRVVERAEEDLASNS